MRWLLVLVGACASAPPRPAFPVGAPSVVHARIAAATNVSLDITVDGWYALDRCRSVVTDQLEQRGLAPDHVARVCDEAVLPPDRSAYQLFVTTEQHLVATPPYTRYSIETIDRFDSLEACEARKAELETQDLRAFEESAGKRRQAMLARIAAVKHECDEARAVGIPDDPSCHCEVVQVPSPTFVPTPRICRVSG